MNDWWRAGLAVIILMAILAAVLYGLLPRIRGRRRGIGPVRRELGCLQPGELMPVGAAGYVTDAAVWLQNSLLTLEPGTQWGGTFAAKPGYHNTRNGNSPSNYSVVERPPDDGGPGDKAAAFDWTFPEAQRGDYSRISVYSTRLLNSSKDPNDPRLNGWREWYGQTDWDTTVEGWDTRHGYAVTSDSSHLWHIHLSESRSMTESYDNKEAMLSVLKGETVAQWRGVVTEGDGDVLLKCPYDEDRLDLFYVGPKGEVWHRWASSGGMNALWSESSPKENLGGQVVPGTLAATWKHDASGVEIVGLGSADSANAPSGCGQYWGMTLHRGGGSTGWGSLAGVYGAVPANVRTVPTTTTTSQRDSDGPVVLAVVGCLLALITLVLAATT